MILDVIRSLINVPSLQELHIFDENSETDWSHLADLQQLKILSISVDSMADAVGHICRLVNLRQIFLNCSPIHPFTVDEATKIGKSLPNLESLIIASVGTNLKISLVPSVIQEFSALRTFLFVSDLPAEEQTIVDLRPFSQRQPPINVFVDSRVFHLCSGESDNVRLINLPYTTNAAAIHFLQLYNQNGFDIKTQFCLMMMSRDREAYGAWNSEIEMDDDLHSDISGGPMDPYLIDEFEDFDDVEEDENSDVDYEDWDG